MHPSASTPGLLYAARIAPKIVKVGFTTIPIERRMRQLSRDFDCEARLLGTTPTTFLQEIFLHHELSRWRVVRGCSREVYRACAPVFARLANVGLRVRLRVTEQRHAPLNLNCG